MKIINDIVEMRKSSRREIRNGKSIGFVPTMGYLHDGHMSLVRRAREECDHVIMSIFVNPTQFGPGEDYEKYPRDENRDKLLAEKTGVDVLFIPSPKDMYPEGFATKIAPDPGMIKNLCGRSRPGHFDGVATVVSKLLNIVCADKAYFGLKDAQQAVVVKQISSDLNIPVEIKTVPIVRENDGLAMSSRNIYLTNDQRVQSLNIFRSLQLAQEMISGGETSSVKIIGMMNDILSQGKDVKVDYIEVVDADTLEKTDVISQNTLIAVAAYVGRTRLIDNVVLK